MPCCHTAMLRILRLTQHLGWDTVPPVSRKSREENTGGTFKGLSQHLHKSIGFFGAKMTSMIIIKGCRPCRRPRKNGQWMKPNWHQYSSVLRTFRFSPFSYVYFYAIYLIKYFDIVRKPTHQTPSPPWAVPRRLQPECGSWAREIIHFIK